MTILNITYQGRSADYHLDLDHGTSDADIRRIAYVLKDGDGYAPAAIYEAFGVRRFADPPRITAAGN